MPRIVRRTTKQKSSKRATASDALGRPRLRGRRGIGRQPCRACRAVGGTVAQTVLLGLAATVSHTSLVWVVAPIGMHFGSQYDGALAEPYFQMASAFLIMAIAPWMLRRTWREQLPLRPAVRQHAHHQCQGHHHTQQDAHELAHADQTRRRFASGNVTTGQIVMFGLSGGLIPCSRSPWSQRE